MPLPSSPSLLYPQASTEPVEVTARPWREPAATAVMVVPGDRLTGTGTFAVGLAAVAQLPVALEPQASLPDAIERSKSA